ncbi:hypothetical protein [Streptomyces longwoodensis]|uniref:hypothetical protein n=1 Tax=Streptomyces longwoodensis TaxID=68231 RepID=UPI0032518D1D
MSEKEPGAVSAPEEPASVLSERLKERIYASLTVLAVLIGLVEGRHVDHTGAVLAVAVTALGLWSATLVADLQARPVAHGRRLDRDDIRHVLFTSSPLLSVAVGPIVLVGLSAAGVLELRTALWVAIGTEVAALAAWGYLGGRRIGSGPLRATVTAALNTLIGLVVVAVKLLAGH